jgi:RNA polymerase sigma factor (sigma-70 family)
MPTSVSPTVDGSWLLQQHRRLTTRHAARLGHAVAEDLASEAVARCLRHPAPDGRHAPWLERIFANLVADHLRRRGRNARHAPALSPPAPLPSPEEQVLRAELLQGLAGAWSAVAPEQRQALLARFCDESARLAQLGGLPLPTIRTRVHRGLAVLRRALARLGAIFPLPLSAPLSLHPMAATLAPLAVAALVLTPPLVAISPRPSAVQQFAQSTSPRPVSSPARQPLPTVGGVPAKPAREPHAAPATKAPGAIKPSDPGRATGTPAVRRFDFENDEIAGDVQRPDGDLVPGSAPRGRHSSLIEIPGSFLAAIVQSLEDI